MKRNGYVNEGSKGSKDGQQYVMVDMLNQTKEQQKQMSMDSGRAGGPLVKRPVLH